MTNLEIEELKTLTEKYILTYYPLHKQQSDVVDKNYWETYLLSHLNVDSNTLHKDIWIEAANIMEGAYDLNTAVNNLCSKYGSEYATAFEQLLKVALRVAWVQTVKSIFNNNLDKDIKPSEVIKFYPKPCF